MSICPCHGSKANLDFQISKKPVSNSAILPYGPTDPSSVGYCGSAAVPGLGVRAGVRQYRTGRGIINYAIQLWSALTSSGLASC